MIQALREKRHEKYNEAKAYQDANRESWSDDTQAQFDRLVEDVRAIDTQIGNYERMMDLESQVSTPNPDAARLGGSAFVDFGDFLRSTMIAGMPGGQVDNRLLASTILDAAGDGSTIGVPSEGGYLVPTTMADELIKRLYENNQVISRCAQRPLMGPLEIPAVDETSRADGSRYGAVRMYWKGEEAQMTEAKPKFAKIKLEPHKLTGLYYASDESLEDIPFLAAEVTDMFLSEADFKVQDALVNGKGNGMPLGLLKCPAKVEVAIEGGQLADTVVTENVINMRSRLWAPSWAKAVFLYNQDAFPQLATMTYAIGTAGVMSNLFDMNNDTIMGKPAIPIEQAATVGDVGDLILVDLSQYIVGQKSGVQSATSIHIKFDYNQTAFRWIIRLDGQCRWKSALTPFKGSPTLSPIVTIAARA